MPTKPNVKAADFLKSGSANEISIETMNVIRKQGTMAYQAAIPEATADNVKEIGSIIANYVPIQNEFLNALVNRIGLVIITSKMYRNPWSMFKRGMLEFGESIEEIFVNLARPHEFDQEVAETEVFKREIPDVKAVFHVLNYRKFYKQTISNDVIRTAFLSWQGVTDLIARIVDQMYSAANYDEFLAMKYMIAKAALNGYIYPSNIPALTEDNARSVVTTIKGMSNDLRFMKTTYNAMGVPTYTDPDDQILILNAKFEAVVGVNVLSLAFNKDYSEFMGRVVLVDGFGDLDIPRLNELFAEDPNYTPLTQAELTALDNIAAVQVDRSWFMIFDNYMSFKENYNGQGLYWNYFFHVWKTLSFSPFANAVLYTTNNPGITSVTVNPATATVGKGSTLKLTSSVVSTGFAPKGVTWAITQANSTSTISDQGVLTVAANEPNGTLTVTATSVYDNTKSGSATITVPA